MLIRSLYIRLSSFVKQAAVSYQATTEYRIDHCTPPGRRHRHATAALRTPSAFSRLKLRSGRDPDAALLSDRTSNWPFCFPRIGYHMKKLVECSRSVNFDSKLVKLSIWFGHLQVWFSRCAAITQLDGTAGLKRSGVRVRGRLTAKPFGLKKHI
eukprot:2093776-Pleurochrysis_carterae.AAC.2